MKQTKKAKNPSLPKDSTVRPTTPTTEEITTCAHAIWEQAGRPEGCELEHWLAAENQLRQARSPSEPKK